MHVIEHEADARRGSRPHRSQHRVEVSTEVETDRLDQTGHEVLGRFVGRLARQPDLAACGGPESVMAAARSAVLPKPGPAMTVTTR